MLFCRKLHANATQPILAKLHDTYTSSVKTKFSPISRHMTTFAVLALLAGHVGQLTAADTAKTPDASVSDNRAADCLGSWQS